MLVALYRGLVASTAGLVALALLCGASCAGMAQAKFVACWTSKMSGLPCNMHTFDVLTTAALAMLIAALTIRIATEIRA